MLTGLTCLFPSRKTGAHTTDIKYCFALAIFTVRRATAIFCDDPKWTKLGHYIISQVEAERTGFVLDSPHRLHAPLEALGQVQLK